MLDRTRNALSTHGRIAVAAVINTMALACNAKTTDWALVQVGWEATLTIIFEDTGNVDHDRLRTLMAGPLEDAINAIYDLAVMTRPRTLNIEPQLS